MEQVCNSKVKNRDFSAIGYYGRPITALSKKELLAAFAELVDIYKECQKKTVNEKSNGVNSYPL